MKNIQLFQYVFVLVLLVLIHLYRPGENLWCHDVTHLDFRSARSGCHGNVTGIKAVTFFNFFIYLLIIFLVSVASLFWIVSVVSFRPFRFVVSGFSTCPDNVCGQISKHIFASNDDYCLHIMVTWAEFGYGGKYLIVPLWSASAAHQALFGFAWFAAETFQKGHSTVRYI